MKEVRRVGCVRARVSVRVKFIHHFCDVHTDRLKGKAGPVVVSMMNTRPLPSQVKYLVPIDDGVTVCLERLRR